MELIRKNIHMNREKCRSSLQLTLDNDLNVPDIKPDIERIVREQGDIKVLDVKVSNGRVNIKGELVTNILYIAEQDEDKIQHMTGSIPFNESVNMSDTCDGDNVQVKWELEDLTADVINSRKVSVKSILKLIVSADEIMDEEAAVAVSDGGYVEQLNETGTVTELALSKKDTYRIKEEVTISSGRDSIREILYQDVVLEEVDMRLTDGQLSLRGELRLFILYSGIENDRINAYETNVGFAGTIDCNGCNESMIPNIVVSIQDKDIQAKEDEDGEDRILDIEIVLGLDMKVYREEEINLLSDMYSTSAQITPVFKRADFNNLVMKNNSKARINERLTLDESNPSILQMCNTVGNVRIDEEKIVPGGISVDGIVEVKLLYFTEEDDYIIGACKDMIPFTHFIEVKGIKDNCIYEINTNVEQINVIVVEGREIEVKATIAIDVIVFEKLEKQIITDCREDEQDITRLMNIPGMTGYIVQTGDTLWNIAKEYSTTIDMIKEMNSLGEEDVMPGDKLLLIKQVG